MALAMPAAFMAGLREHVWPVLMRRGPRAQPAGRQHISLVFFPSPSLLPRLSQPSVSFLADTPSFHGHSNDACLVRACWRVHVDALAVKVFPISADGVGAAKGSCEGGGGQKDTKHGHCCWWGVFNHLFFILL